MCGMLALVGTMVRDILMGSLEQLRYEPVEKRIEEARAVLEEARS